MKKMIHIDCVILVWKCPECDHRGTTSLFIDLCANRCSQCDHLMKLEHIEAHEEKIQDVVPKYIGVIGPRSGWVVGLSHYSSKPAELVIVSSKVYDTRLDVTNAINIRRREFLDLVYVPIRLNVNSNE